ncbi:MAG: hypothetical protein P4L83_21405 [Nevskia sp.]|nr:hypothetical protein [Nevskia sp.]
MLHLVAHPKLLIVAAVICLPALLPLARYFFDDVETFKRDLGLGNSVGRFAWLIGTPLEEYTLELRIFCFVGCYGIVVLLAYSLMEKIGTLFHAFGN